MSSFIKLSLSGILFLIILSCSSTKLYESSRDELKQLASANLANDIQEFNRYDGRPNADGSFTSSNNTEFLLKNTPVFLSSDTIITKVFNYRFWMMLKHLKDYRDPEDDTNYWVYTEFYGYPNHASRSAAIPCPLGHQFYDARWVQDPQYLKSYAEYFLQGSASRLNQRENGSFLTNLSRPESHHFSSWLVNGVEAFLKVHPDKNWMQSMLPAMEQHQQVWDELFTVANKDSKTSGMYKIMDLYDGMEFSLSAVEALIASDGPFDLYTTDNWREYYLGWSTTQKAANSEQAKNFPRAFNGGYPWFYLVRPSINSYAYGNLHSLSNMYSDLGNENRRAEFEERANSVMTKTLDILWSDEKQFFMSLSAGDNEFGVTDFETEVRESVGYTPWYFNMIPQEDHSKYDVAWKFFPSEKGFKNNRGMTTAERQHPYYNEQAYAWNGRGWPFQNSVVYKAYANYLRNYKNEVSEGDKQVLLDNINQLAALHGKDQKNIGEWYIPSDGEEFGGVPDYFHSTFPDIIISDLLGIAPQLDGTVTISPLLPIDSWEYFYLGDLVIKDHTVDFYWKKDWNPAKEGNQSSLKIWVDGSLIDTKNSDNGAIRFSLN